MRIGLYHGYELTGSGSNEYTRYLARYLLDEGHEIHLICREEHPQEIPYITHGYAWERDGTVRTLFENDERTPACYLHGLPHASIRPVFLTDKQRTGNVKSFVALTDEELQEYHNLNETVLTRILTAYRLDVLHANHVVYQPVAALQACQKTGTPLIIYPHGSAIEYTVKADARYKELALKGILGSTGLIIGNREVRDRILNLYPEHRETILNKSKIVGVGVDTSLFQPVPRKERDHSIGRLIATEGGGGKSPEQTTELQQRLQQQDIQATRDYWNSYNHALPDADLNDHLRQIPWEQDILLFVGALTAGKGIRSLITALPSVLRENPETHLVIVGAGAYREVLEALVYAISTSNKKLLLELCAHGLDLDRNELTGPWDDVQTYLNQSEHLDFIMKHGNILTEYVHFLGRLDHSRLCYLFPCADLAIFPSVVPEAYPLVVMESLSNGVLPLVSYFSGFKDSVDDLRPLLGERLNDLMKIPVDKETRIPTIISNLNTLLSDETVHTIHPRLRQIAVNNYDWKLRAHQMSEAYRAFLS